MQYQTGIPAARKSGDILNTPVTHRAPNLLPEAVRILHGGATKADWINLANGLINTTAKYSVYGGTITNYVVCAMLRRELDRVPKSCRLLAVAQLERDTVSMATHEDDKKNLIDSIKLGAGKTYHPIEDLEDLEKHQTLLEGKPLSSFSSLYCNIGNMGLSCLLSDQQFVHWATQPSTPPQKDEGSMLMDEIDRWEHDNALFQTLDYPRLVPLYPQVKEAALRRKWDNPHSADAFLQDLATRYIKRQLHEQNRCQRTPR